MKILAAIMGLALSFNVLAEEVPFENPGAMISLGKFVKSLNEGGVATTSALMLYINGTFDTMRMLKLICPLKGQSDQDVLMESLFLISTAYHRAQIDRENAERNLALPTSFYLLDGYRRVYPCPDTPE